MKRIFNKICIIGIIIITIPSIVLFCRGYKLYKEATSDITIEEKVAEIRRNADFTKLEDISPTFLNGIISVEDHRFYEHHGVDYKAICGALYDNVRNGSIVRGGSTITQQLAKNMFLTNEQTVERKVAEILIAKELEKQYTKEDILELYVNIIYYGDGYYGIKEASKGYFGCEPDKLTDGQAVIIAGLPQAPEEYAPSRNYNDAKERSKVVLGSMVRNMIISKERADRVYNTEINKLSLSY